MFRKAINILLVSGAIVAMIGCNTVRGAGEDLESASNTVDNEM